MKALVEEVGGAEAAVKFVERRGMSSIELAVELVGGAAQLARTLGVSQPGIHRMMQRDATTWKAPYLIKLAELSGIPLEVLLKSQGRRGPRRGRAK